MIFHLLRFCYQDGQISIDPKDEVFIEVMVKRNHAQVKETFKQYEKVSRSNVYFIIILLYSTVEK